MARDRWIVYVCPECGELNLYAGFCDNRDAHAGMPRLVKIVVQAIHGPKA